MGIILGLVINKKKRLQSKGDTCILRFLFYLIDFALANLYANVFPTETSSLANIEQQRFDLLLHF